MTDYNFPIYVLLFFIILFFIYHIYYRVKDNYEGFTTMRGGFSEGFANIKKDKMKKRLSLREISERANKNLPSYEYKEDIPRDERDMNIHNTVVNNSELVGQNMEKELDIIDKNLDNTDFIFNTGNDIWNKFYCSIYDALHLDTSKNKYEVREIIYTTDMKKDDKILDIGSGTGHHVNAFNKKGYKAVGIDSSISMVNLAKKNFPDSEFYNSDVMHGYQFKSNAFTHVTMLMMTIYYIKNKTAAFHNIYNWLKPGGYMVIHLVDRDKFDPRIEAADPLEGINAQLFSKKRLTKSYVKFNSFQYRGEFLENGDNSKYVETLKDDDGPKAIRNEHKYSMEKIVDIVNKAKKVGFIMKGKIGLDRCQWNNEYLYVFKKK